MLKLACLLDIEHEREIVEKFDEILIAFEE